MSKNLPMDDAARNARAASMGFRSETFFHGTAGTFSEFDLSKGGQVSGSRAGGQGVSISPTVDVAKEFASSASGKSGMPANVMNLRARLGKVGAVTLTGVEKNLEVAATLAESFKSGYDTVVLKNYTTPAGKKGNTVLVVKDPSQLRSVDAKFDPSKIASRNLMAGLAGPLTVGSAVTAGFLAYEAKKNQAHAAGQTPAVASRNAAIAGAATGAATLGVIYGVGKGLQAAAKVLVKATPRVAPALGPLGAAVAAGAVTFGAIRGYQQAGSIKGAAFGAISGGAVPESMKRSGTYERTYTKGPKAGTTETVRMKGAS